MVSPVKICVLTSGGLDSSLLLQHALEGGHEVYPLYIQSGLSWETQEREALEHILRLSVPPGAQSLKTIRTSLQDYLPDHWGFHPEKIPEGDSHSAATFVPGRNLFLLTHAGHYAFSKNLTEIWIGTLKGSVFTDAKNSFYQSMEKLFLLSFGREVKIKAPFSHLSKVELIRSHPDFHYQHTLTCLHPTGGKHCGHCLKCTKRRRAFQEASVPDPTKYITP